VVSCTFDFVPDVDVDYDEINVYADGEVVPFDESCDNGAGWDWGNAAMTQITLCPEACDNLKTGLWKIITATAGCPVIIIE